MGMLYRAEVVLYDRMHSSFSACADTGKVLTNMFCFVKLMDVLYMCTIDALRSKMVACSRSAVVTAFFYK